MKKNRYPRIIIAGMKGGAGKTTVSLGLIAAWREMGLSVVPYKKGPDYIDSGWLSSAAGRPCYNLDAFLISRERILASFREHYSDADCAVIEGNRGLFDGMDAIGTYSTAELAKTLKAPVLVVLDCTKVTRTAGAFVLGMQRFDPSVELGGIILNRIAGARHENVIREVIEKYCKLPVVGAIPKMKKDFLSERHMGLTPFQEHQEVDKAIVYAAEIAKKYLNLDAIGEIAQKAKKLPAGSFHNEEALKYGGKASVVIGILRDAAFQFYYPENLEELEKKGATLIEINAMAGKALPEIDALYIGGGFPETNAIGLSQNTKFRRSLKAAAEQGLPVYAECGGLMYLGESLVLEGTRYPMAGIFPIDFCLEKKPQAHGYTVVETRTKTPFFAKGTILKGHEFHYSRPIQIGKKKGMQFGFDLTRGQGISGGKDGLFYKNVFATYTHIHALGAPEWVEGMIRQACAYQKRKGAEK